MSKGRKSLNNLIEELDFIGDNFNYLLENSYDEIVAKLVAMIGKTTAYDTGVARELIKDILSDLGKPEYSAELEHEIYEYWKSVEERKQENSSYSFSKVKNDRNYEYRMSINDDGFAQQQDGKVSSIHPRNDSNVVPFNVDLCSDKLETGSAEYNKVFNDLERIIVRIIERGF